MAPMEQRLAAALEVIDDLSYHLRCAAEEVNEVNVANGWFEEDRPFEADVALLHSEVSEMFEAYRDRSDTTWFEHKPDCVHVPLNELHDIVPDRPGCTCVPKPHGIGPEAADILVRLLDTSLRHDIDLGQEFRRVLAHNRTRGRKHGDKRV